MLARIRALLAPPAEPDPYALELRRASARLGAYARTLHADARKHELQAASDRATLEAEHAESWRSLSALHSFGASSALLGRAHERAALASRRAWLKIVLCGAAAQALHLRARAGDSWRRHIDAIASEREGEVAAGLGAPPLPPARAEAGARAGLEARLPLDVGAFVAPLGDDVVRACAPAERVARRIQRLDERLAELDAELAAPLQGAARKLAREERSAELRALVIAEADAAAFLAASAAAASSAFADPAVFDESRREQGAARLVRFGELVLDQRGKDGRLLQRSCHLLFAQGLHGVVYAADLGRFLAFGAGAAFAAKVRSELGIEAPDGSLRQRAKVQRAVLADRVGDGGRSAGEPPAADEATEVRVSPSPVVARKISEVRYGALQPPPTTTTTTQSIGEADGTACAVRLAGALPSSRVVAALLAHLCREIASNAKIAPGSSAASGLRILIERLVFGRIHTHCFAGIEAVPAFPLPAGETSAESMGRDEADPPTLTLGAPLRPRGSAADVLLRRDLHWQRALLGVCRLSAADIGVTAAFVAPLPDDEVVSQGESAFAATSARLSLLDEPLHPRTLAQLLVACIDAAVEEAKARARGSGATHEVTAEELTPLVIFVASRSRWRCARATCCLWRTS